MSNCRAALVLLLGVFLLLGMGSLSQPNPIHSKEPTAKEIQFPQGKFGKGSELKYLHGAPVLTLTGTPQEMGTSAGKMARSVSKMRVWNYPDDVLKATAKHLRVPEAAVRKSVLKKCLALYKQFPERYKTELDALIRTSGISRETLILGNTLFDLPARGPACSAILIEAKNSATGGVLFGRNLDFPTQGYLYHYGLVSVYKPKGKHAFVSIAFPGMVGCLSGMNDAGLCLAVHESYNARNGETRFNEKGIPYALCYRQLLEECTTIAEAKKLLTSLPRTRWTNLSIADRKGTAVFEVTPDTVQMRTGTQGYTVCTNHFCTRLASPKGIDFLPSSQERFEKLTTTSDKLLSKGKIGVKDVQQMLSLVSVDFPGFHTIQSMVFEPATLKLHLAMGKVPSTKSPWMTLDLGPLFK